MTTVLKPSVRLGQHAHCENRGLLPAKSHAHEAQACSQRYIQVPTVSEEWSFLFFQTPAPLGLNPHAGSVSRGAFGPGWGAQCPMLTALPGSLPRQADSEWNMKMGTEAHFVFFPQNSPLGGCCLHGLLFFPLGREGPPLWDGEDSQVHEATSRQKRWTVLYSGPLLTATWHPRRTRGPREQRGPRRLWGTVAPGSCRRLRSAGVDGAVGWEGVETHHPEIIRPVLVPKLGFLARGFVPGSRQGRDHWGPLSSCTPHCRGRRRSLVLCFTDTWRVHRLTEGTQHVSGPCVSGPRQEGGGPPMAAVGAVSR